MIAMATMPGGIQSASERREKSLTLKRSRIKVDDQWDVIIVGGGPAGCTAAIAATREGAKTLLIEAMGQLGGMVTKDFSRAKYSPLTPIRQANLINKTHFTVNLCKLWLTVSTKILITEA